MKIENFDLRMFSDHYREKVWLNERFERVKTDNAHDGVEPASESAAIVLKRLSEDEMSFHKKVISEFLLHLSKIPDKTEFNTEITRLKQYGEELNSVQQKGRLIDSALPGDSEGNRIQMVGERSLSLDRAVVEFSTKGRITTSLRSIEVDIEFTMRRNTLSNKDITRLLKDPLVINYDTTLASLSEQKFHFDIDSDGLEDQISLLKRGSGFLALDRNNDGRINNGKELFGTESGNGFEDLRLYDSDGNGWIDENDPIFEKLRIWIRNDAGEDRLVALGEVGVGAIYLGHVETLFNMTDAENETTQGMLTHSGIFLKENGDAGIVQNIELSVETEEENAATREYKAMDANAFRSDYSEFVVTDSVKQGNAFSKPEDTTKTVQGIKEEQADLRRELKQLQSRLKHLVDANEQEKIQAKIDQLKAKLSAAEGYEVQQLFNTLR